MSNIFTLENITDFTEKLNIDDLYEKKKQYDLNKLTLYNKLLNRIHVRIKTTSKQKINEQFCWFVVPEIIIGVPKFDQGNCIAYLIDKLRENGFKVQYFDPNTLFISWNHWVPTYIRNEFKKKTGILIDQFGNKIDEQITIENNNQHKSFDIFKINNNDSTSNSNSNTNSKIKNQTNKNFTPIDSYKPQGNFIYNTELLNHLEQKFA